MGVLGKLFGSRKSPQERFADLVMADLEATGNGGVMQFDAEEMAITIAGSDGLMRLNLKNAYSEYLAAEPGERGPIVRRYAQIGSAPAQIQSDSGIAGERLLPKLHPRRDNTALMMKAVLDGNEAHLDFVHFSFTDSLFVQLSYDAPTSIRSVNDGDLERWGMGRKEALAKSMKSSSRSSGISGRSTSNCLSVFFAPLTR